MVGSLSTLQSYLKIKTTHLNITFSNDVMYIYLFST